MKKLYILWTNADITTSRLMVFMYAGNSLKHKWWDSVTIIIWGASSKLIKENTQILKDIKDLMDIGVRFIACKACADEIGSTETLSELGVSVDYIGNYLTNVIKDKDNHLITV